MLAAQAMLEELQMKVEYGMLNLLSTFSRLTLKQEYLQV